jgi:TM2 domain-containing membrane protein YozV
MKMTICSSCGFEMGNGKYCPKCGALSASATPPPPSQHQTQQNWQQPPPQYGQQPQYGMPPQYGQPYAQRKDKTTTALLAIFLGGLGIHKFYLGGPKQKTAGIIQIVVTIITCGFGSILGLIEGIIYLTKDEQQFQYEYVQGGKDWF